MANETKNTTSDAGKDRVNKRLGFYFDQTLCNGCKACQIACKDKHDTPIGVNWRRVVEYSGGDWATNSDGVMQNSTFTYYTSISCNHCDNPICTQVCPTTAMHIGEDGVVTVDPDKCVGCRYCEWACPYSAPQFNVDKGVMTKCDLCADYRSEGKEPACVASCPSRALDWGPIDELREEHGDVNGIAPLPDPSLTEPRLAMRPHKDAKPWDRSEAGEIANPTEV
ncbi:DMSO/selenate family reductase complex B subunit [Corynebacterium cystitidis]|uniref:DMSO/selenate family reductase complex B subunit n=1 Tax=Corynebacterium cystitidis TaxID=35757 RepID=UPI00211EEBE2|nr:DMSO/selenate family reductase complex B subunit [Corynebacterium cystitidis]